MSRIVVVITDPPLPFGNASARWFYVLLRGLVDRGHDVTALSAFEDPAHADEARALFPSPRYDLRLFPRQAPGGLRRKINTILQPYSFMYGDELRADLRATLAKGFDILHLEHLWGGWLGLDHADKSLVNVEYLFRIDLAEAPVTGLADRVRRAATRRAEERLLRAYPTISTFTPRLTDVVSRISPRSDVHTVPLGLDLSLYPFRPDDPGHDRPVVGLIGSFNWQPTYSAGVRLLTRLWPEIHRRVPGAQLRIVGRKARSALAPLATGPDIELIEDVPDTIPYFHDTDVLLYAAQEASGMKVKVLEAFALGTPVVTTADGVEGIPAEDGVHCGLAEDDAGLVDRAVALLEDRSLRERRRLAARQLLHDHCSPAPVLDRLEHVYAAILEKGRRARG